MKINGNSTIESGAKSENTEAEAVLTFPCDVDVKVFARRQPGMESTIKDLVLTVMPEQNFYGIKSKISSKGNYQSFTCSVIASDRKQIDTLFEKLCEHPDIKMVL